MVAMVTLSQGSGALVAVSGAGGAGSAVEIHEENVFVQLGKPEESCDAKTWIVDIGATNHMTGSRSAFVDIDTRVRGTVRFGDDSAAEIEGSEKWSSSAGTASAASSKVCISSPSSRLIL
jgi:hypothetical protein